MIRCSAAGGGSVNWGVMAEIAICNRRLLPPTGTARTGQDTSPVCEGNVEGRSSFCEQKEAKKLPSLVAVGLASGRPCVGPG
jgi:hypothetical protein